MRAETLAAILRSIEQTGVIDFDSKNKRCNDTDITNEMGSPPYHPIFSEIMHAVGQRQRELQIKLSTTPAELARHPLFNLKIIRSAFLGYTEVITENEIAAIHCLLPDTLNTVTLDFNSFISLKNDGARFFQHQHAVQTLTVKVNIEPYTLLVRTETLVHPIFAPALDQQKNLRNFTLIDLKRGDSDRPMLPPEGLIHCKLEKLHLEKIRIGARDIGAWQRVITQNRETLKAVTLDQCWITREGITALLQPLHDSPVLTGLTLNLNQDHNPVQYENEDQERDDIKHHHKIDIDRVKTLLNVVSTCPSLSTLVVTDNSLGCKMDNPQPPKNNYPHRMNDTETESMDARLAKIPQQGLTWLLRTLSTQNIPLQKLDLQEMAVFLHKDAAQLLSDFLKNTRTLRQLNLYITACEAKANPFAGLADNTSLQKLNIVVGCLVQDDILPELLLALFQALNKNQTLRIFSLKAKGVEHLDRNVQHVLRDRFYEQLVTHRSLQRMNLKDSGLLLSYASENCIPLLTALCFNTSLLKSLNPEIRTTTEDYRRMPFLNDLVSDLIHKMSPRNKKLAQQRSALLKLAPLIAHTRANFRSPIRESILPLLQPSNTELTIANFMGRSRTASGRSMNETEQACYKHLWRIFSYAILYLFRYRNSSTPQYQLLKSLVEAMTILLEQNLLTLRHLRNTMINSTTLTNKLSKTPIEQASLTVIDTLQHATQGHTGSLADSQEHIMQHAKCVLDLLTSVPSTNLRPASDQHTCTVELPASYKWPGPG